MNNVKRNCHSILMSRRFSLTAALNDSPTDTPKLYNPLEKSTVPLKCRGKNYLTWYSCGPTVYDDAHIGHGSCYIRLDIIRRVFSHWFGLTPIVAMGVTDIDDKILAKAKVLGVDFRTVAKKYEVEFFSDMQKLNVQPAHFILRVSEHIPDIIKFVETIVKKNHGYILDDGSVYFDTQSLDNYGKVTRAPALEAKPSKPGGRRHPADFALWKAGKPGEPSWPSPWSDGRPGWHIECSAMACKLFGNHLDVHTGGLDLAFPHHENEEAQCCAYHTTPQWVDQWIHTGHLLMNGMKMSKSMKNFIPISTFLEEYTADHLRMLCLMTHYRSSINYAEDVLKKSVAMVNKLSTFLTDSRNYQKGSWDRGNISTPILLEELEKTKSSVISSLASDINTAQCINHIEQLVKTTSAMLHADAEGSREPVALALVADFVEKFLMSLGLFQHYSQEKNMESTDEYLLDKLVGFRGYVREIALTDNGKKVRKELFTGCDNLRKDLAAIGVTVKDTSDLISSWSRNS